MDIKGGRCVRLYQGDFSQETVFSDEPFDVALEWQSLGAPRLHVVDLDGAATGELQNLEIIRNIAQAVIIPVQVGGGIRDLAMVETLLKAEVDRVILGTIAVQRPEVVAEACRRFRESVIVSIDAQEGRVATHGWQRQTEIEAKEFARSMVELGVRRFIYTDISRDGTLTEPNFTAFAELLEALRLPLIAAGGISSLTHLKMLKQLGAEGAIVGRALYTGDIDLKQALDAVS